MAVRALVAGACVLATAIASPGIAAANPGSSDGPTIPYAPPAEDHGGVRNPTVPSMVWAPIEGAAGRIIGADLGAAALDDLACTPITAIHVPGTGDTNVQRDPDDPHGRIVSGPAHDLGLALGDDVRSIHVPYPADVALSASYVGYSARGMGILDGLVSAVDARATAEALRTALGADIAGDPELREALDDVLRFLLDGSADHLTYEDDLEGLGSAREAALAFLLEHLAG